MTFKTAIIDPPWPYDRVSASTKLSGFVSQDGKNHYGTLSLADLEALPVSQVMDPDTAYLFLWTTGPFTESAYKLVRAWGFEPKSQICWHKSDPGLGVGYWFRGSHELVIVAKRPSAPSVRTGRSSVISLPRRGHSIKPDTIHEICEAHFPHPYLELFGRRLRPGWTVLGNEAPGDGKDIRESLLQRYYDRAAD